MSEHDDRTRVIGPTCGVQIPIPDEFEQHKDDCRVWEQKFRPCGKPAVMRMCPPGSKTPINVCAKCVDGNLLALYQCSDEAIHNEDWFVEDLNLLSILVALAPKEE